MNPLIHFKRTIVSLLIGLMFGCFGLLPTIQAVVPAPDGGYPGGNTAEGQAALLSLTTGGFNTAVGFFSLRSDTTGAFNTATGAGTLLANTADRNTATGAGALLSNVTGVDNTANGAFALLNNTGSGNTAMGAGALVSNTTDANNTAVGIDALHNHTSGGSNTAIGAGALVQNTTGSGNIAIGPGAGFNVTTASNVISIGAAGADVNNSCYVKNIWNQPGGSQAVYVNSDGKLGAQVSSRRFKDEIKPVDKASEAIYALKPVSFRYKAEIEPTRPLSFGLIAEDVQKINPDLVMRNADGKPASVRYDAVNAMLLNEFLKEHKKVAELEATVAGLARAVKEQAVQIRKVTSELETSKAFSRVVLNEP
jgi:hypothetical protein